MATKTITIDLEAYNRLKAVRRDHESFSQIIKRVVRARLDVDAYMARLDENPMSRNATAAIEEHLRRRHAPSERTR